MKFAGREQIDAKCHDCEDSATVVRSVATYRNLEQIDAKCRHCDGTSRATCKSIQVNFCVIPVDERQARQSFIWWRPVGDGGTQVFYIPRMLPFWD